MPNYILNERDEAVEAGSWENYAEWWCANRDSLVIASDDIRDGKDRYITTVTTRYRGHIENVADLTAGKPRVWLTQTAEEDLSKSAATKGEAEENHRRMVR